MDAALAGLLEGRRLDARAERLVFAMFANRALAAGSKRACAERVGSDVVIPGLGEVGDPQPLYRAMDWLLEVGDALAQAVYWATPDLLNLEVDLTRIWTDWREYLGVTVDAPGQPRDLARDWHDLHPEFESVDSRRTAPHPWPGVHPGSDPALHRWTRPRRTRDGMPRMRTPAVRSSDYESE